MRFSPVIPRLLCCLICSAPLGWGASWKWEAIGIGGGGQFLNPAISPHDPKLLFASSDMGGVYRSADGGLSWTTIPQSMLKRLEYAPYSQVIAFHPEDPALILTGASNGFCRSRDKGMTWEVIRGPWMEGPSVVTFLAGSNAAIAFFGDFPAKGRITPFTSADNGATWTKAGMLPEEAGGVINAVALENQVVVGTKGGVFRGDASGAAWVKSEAGLPAGVELTDFEGASATGVGLFYVSGGGDLYASNDGAKTWKALAVEGVVTHLAISPTNPRVVYASVKKAGPSGESGLRRSEDAGATWVSVWNHDIKDAGYDVTNTSWLTGKWGSTHAPSGVTADPKNPSRVFTTTITSALLSEDSGKTWRQVHAPVGSAEKQPAGGMMVTTVWNYHVHPKKPGGHCAALTDFAGWTSQDGAATWRYSIQGSPWHNMYAMALDPEDPLLLWAACSATHDLPTWKYQSALGTYQGGVASSADGGATWQPIDTKSGLPRKAVTDIWLDPSSPATARQLWAALPGQGIYFSADSGVTWESRNNGFSKWNQNLLRVGGDGKGKLYALSTVRVQGNNRSQGELYASNDKGANWRKIFSEKSSPFLTNFHAGPDGALFVCALSTEYNDDKGGALWRSKDGGSTWKISLDHPVYGVAVDPRSPTRVYASSWKNRGDGLYQSDDGGDTWAKVEGYPYWEPMNISFDPAKPDVIYVTNFGGGVFRGTLRK